jgi:hypothetical protein
MAAGSADDVKMGAAIVSDDHVLQEIAFEYGLLGISTETGTRVMW